MDFSSVFIELDALLDTRAGTLLRLGDDHIQKAVDKGYHTRKSDEFSDEFLELYANRDVLTIKHAMVTPMCKLLRDFTHNTHSNIINTPFHYKPKIIINIAPYKLTDNDTTVIIKAVVAATDQLADVEIVDLTYSDMSVSYIKNNISILILYDYWKWLEAQAVLDAFKTLTCPETMLVGPAIYFKPIDKNTPIVMDAFKTMERMTAQFIKLMLFPIAEFSFKLPN